MNREFFLFGIFYRVIICNEICSKYIDIQIKCNVSSICNILNVSSVYEYVAGLGQLFRFPRKTVEFPIHFCLVYFRGTKAVVSRK
jgi:hypothetical protein